MFIIDEIHFNSTLLLSNDYGGGQSDRNSNTPTQTTQTTNSTRGTPNTPRILRDIIGGAGTYTALGARIAATSTHAPRVGWIVDCGSDFPAPIRAEIESWGTSCVFRETPERLTTRGWNGYGSGEQRAFRYMTPKLRLDEASLTGELLGSRTFHLICGADRCVSLVAGILRRRREEGIKGRPVFVWEPVPDLCTVEEWDKCKKALGVVDVVSPNHVEIGGFFGMGEEKVKERRTVEDLARKFKEVVVGEKGNGHVVVRAGLGGCCVLNGGSGEVTWLPIYHEKGSVEVVDPTGAGNTFLGGLAWALANGQTIETAAAYGSVVAGVAIEQIGTPKLEGEAWNGLSFADRCKLYRERLKAKDIGVIL
jgi:sugar/nucleoside kinase (ribokinase family)